ncbi:DNA primase noncatalytic subunit PriX [Candidatus Nitrosocosmicus franklandus]|nr:DNA primase noncatalytic subunit PriX [Candidatus Nitrosocosmicus franklandus]
MNSEDIDFIMSHFGHQLQDFPRKMMTDKIGAQVPVFSKEEIFIKCQESDFIDCRINAYPEYTEYQGIVRHPPNFIFIDLDLSKFKNSKKKLDNALENTLNNIHYLGAKPTVMWSGNGYHIYLPIEAMVLDLIDKFSKDKFPSLFSDNYYSKYHGYSVSELFLKFAKDHLTNGNADPQHHPKYKTCLIRFPNTYNSKNIGNGLTLEESKVRLIQKWDGGRIPIQLLLKDFRRWIAQEELDQKRRIRRIKSKILNSKSKNSEILWIEKLLQIPLEDHRKYCLFHILVPYLVNVKKLPPEEISQVIVDWLSKCNNVKHLDFDPVSEIKNKMKYVKSYKPMSLPKLRRENKCLFQVLFPTIGNFCGTGC